VAGLFQHGPNTTGYISLDRQIARGAGRYGWQDTDRQDPAKLPVYALRLNTGGAIVVFSHLRHRDLARPLIISGPSRPCFAG
jgi:hypothetical protein